IRVFHVTGVQTRALPISDDNRALTRYRRDKIGFVFQFYTLVPNLTAKENVMVATEIARNPLDVDEILELVGLGERKDHFPSQMRSEERRVGQGDSEQRLR